MRSQGAVFTAQGFPIELLTLFLELLPQVDRARSACVSKAWWDACRRLDWTRLDLRGLGPLFPERLRNAVAMARGKLDKLDLTDTVFFGNGGPAEYDVMVRPSERYNSQEAQRLLLLEIVNASEADNIDLRVACTDWCFDCTGVALLLAGAPNLCSLEVDLSLSLNELGFFLCLNRASFARVRVRRLVLTEVDDGTHTDGLEALMRAFHQHDFSCLRCKRLVLQGYDFRNFHQFGQLTPMLMLRSLLLGADAVKVQVLELKDVVFVRDEAWSEVGTWFTTALTRLRSFKINTGDGDLMYTDSMLDTVCSALVRRFSNASRKLMKLTFGGGDIRPQAAIKLLRVLATHGRVAQLVLSFNRLVESPEAISAFLNLIRSNNSTLRIIWMRTARESYLDLDLVYAAMRHNTHLQRLYLRFNPLDPAANIKCDARACTIDKVDCELVSHLASCGRDLRVRDLMHYY
jgi:hypothetical protein